MGDKGLKLVLARAGDFAALFCRVSPCGASFFPSNGKETKGSPGDGSGWTLRVHIRLTPGPPLRGTHTRKYVENFRRAKSEWLVSIPAGPLGPGLAKIVAGAVSRLRLALSSQRKQIHAPRGSPTHVKGDCRGGACPSRRFTEPHLSPTATKALSKRGVSSLRLAPSQRQRKTRDGRSTEPPAPLRRATSPLNWRSRKTGSRGWAAWRQERRSGGS